jgi:TonB family protein
MLLSVVNGHAQPATGGDQYRVEKVGPESSEIATNNICPGFASSVVRPLGTTHTPPPYPSEAIGKSLQGISTLKVILSQDGGVKDVHVVESSAASLLDSTAIEHIAKIWRWEALPEACKKTEVSVSVKIDWSLSEVPGIRNLAVEALLGHALITVVVDGNNYPKEPLRRGESGMVAVAAFISPGGEVTRTKILSTSGYASLDNDALNVVKSRTWQPAKMGGKPVGTVTAMMVWYNLPGKPALTADQIEQLMNILGGLGGGKLELPGR